VLAEIIDILRHMEGTGQSPPMNTHFAPDWTSNETPSVSKSSLITTVTNIPGACIHTAYDRWIHPRSYPSLRFEASNPESRVMGLRARAQPLRSRTHMITNVIDHDRCRLSRGLQTQELRDHDGPEANPGAELVIDDKSVG
jgi:hypothetical protein